MNKQTSLKEVEFPVVCLKSLSSPISNSSDLYLIGINFGPVELDSLFGFCYLCVLLCTFCTKYLTLVSIYTTSVITAVACVSDTKRGNF